MRRTTATLAAAVTAVALAGCSPALAGDPDDGRPTVVAAFYPLQFVAEQVGGDQVHVENLTRPGAEPHDLELTARQVAKVVDADVVLFQHGFQPALDQAVEQNAPKAALDVADAVHLKVHHDAEVEDEAGEHTGHGHEHAAEGTDPHFWLDPTRLSAVADLVAERLSAADPSHAAEFARRAQTLTERLTALDHEFAAGLRTCARRTFVTSHAAFGYLAERYDLDMVAISGITPDAEPSPARIREVQGIVRRSDVDTIFSERLLSPKVAETMSRDLGVRTAVLDPLESLTSATAGEDYFTIMRANLAALQKANGCS
jgi:zinc transport system substrate-binding protein